VLAQDPPPHAQGIAQPSINLLVAAPDGDTPDGYVMPDLTGLPVASAKEVLARVGIKASIAKVVEAAATEGTPLKSPVKPSSVIAQQPIAGARVDQNTLVRLTVGK
jgi:beta-lactam-binding protein with PASTA domain